MGLFFRPPLVGDSLIIPGTLAFNRKVSGASDIDSAGAIILAVTTTPRTVTLLSADIVQKDRVFIIQDETGTAGDFGFDITVVTEGAETINGAAGVSVTSDYGNLILYSDGANLFILNKI